MLDIFREQQGRKIVAGLKVSDSRRPDNVGPFRVIVRNDHIILHVLGVELADKIQDAQLHLYFE